MKKRRFNAVGFGDFYKFTGLKKGKEMIEILSTIGTMVLAVGLVVVSVLLVVKKK